VIRPLRAGDYAAVSAIHRRLRVDGIYSERSVRHTIETMPPRANAAAWVAEDGVSIVGWAFAHRRWWRAADSAYAWAGVLPEARGCGIGAELWRACEAHVAGLGVERLYSDDVDDPDAQRFLATNGFAPDRLDRISAVDPRRVDLRDFAARETRAREDGYRLARFRDAALEDLYALELDVSDDMPGGDAPHEFTFEEWRADIVEHPELTDEGSAVVLHDGVPVAHSLLSANLDVRRARNEGTGTLRAHRGRGLATLAKLAAIRWAAAHRIESIVTDNADGNSPMLAINRRLGYREIATRRRWARQPAGAE
jgi:GNAT superfamily N-acetyltransferase